MLKKRKKGFTLIELIVTISIMTIVMGVVVTSFTFLFKLNKSTTDSFNAQSAAQNLMQMIRAELQYASAVTIEAAAPDNFTGNNSSGNFIYMKDYGAFRRLAPATTETSLSNELHSQDSSCSLVFTKSSSKSVKLEITVLKNGTPLFVLNTDIYINNLSYGAGGAASTIGGLDSGTAVRYSTTIVSPTTTAVGATTTTTTTYAYVTSIAVTSSASSVNTNMGTLQMTATVYPTNAINKNIVWSVSDTTKAKINATTGLLTAMGNGTVTVIATATDGSNISGTSATITFTNQTIKVTSFVITVAGGATSVSRNSSLQLTAGTFLPTTAPFSSKKVTWEVNNPSYASIDSTGKITAGSTKNVSIIITATSIDGWAVTRTIEINITS